MAHSGKRVWRVLLWVFVALLVIIGGVTFALARAIAPINSLTIGAVDLAQVADGKYEGEYSTVPVSATVEVTVANHEITDIRIVRHSNGRGAAGEAVTDRVLEAQSLAVDTVAGATYSSKVILKATELALLKGIK